MDIWHKETTPGTTGSRCTIKDENGLFVAECIASDAALIVDAPAMLTALRHIAGEFDRHGSCCALGAPDLAAILARIDGEG